MPDGHTQTHGNGLLTPTPTQDTWTLPPVPVFGIKASDPFACAVIRVWLAMASSYKSERNGVVHRVSHEKIVGAWNRLREFENWQEANGTKLPD